MGCIFWVVIWPLREVSWSKIWGFTFDLAKCWPGWLMNLVLILLSCFVPIFLHSSSPGSNSPEDSSMEACISGSPFLESRLRYTFSLKVTIKLSGCDFLCGKVTSTYFCKEFLGLLNFCCLAGVGQLYFPGANLLLLMFQLIFSAILSNNWIHR